MKESVFQFTNPVLLNMNFKVNMECDFEKFEQEEKAIEPEISIDIRPNNKGKDDRCAVALKINIDKKEYPFFLELEICAIFKWKDTIQKEKVRNLLRVNAPALLLSYTRPIIANITQQGGLPPYHIPFMNFTEQEE